MTNYIFKKEKKKKKKNDVVVDVAQRESGSIKCYTLAFSNIQISNHLFQIRRCQEKIYPIVVLKNPLTYQVTIVRIDFRSSQGSGSIQGSKQIPLLLDCLRSISHNTPQPHLPETNDLLATARVFSDFRKYGYTRTINSRLIINIITIITEWSTQLN